MRPFFGFLLVLVAGTASAAMGPEEARHLLNRTGFQARLAEIDAYAPLDRRAAVERLLGETRTVAGTPVPPQTQEWVPPRRLREASADERKLLQQEFIQRGLALKGWWLSEMLATPSPLTERMTLFWHNHFTSSLQKVRSPLLLQRQNALLRRHALGSFRELLHAASKDPAMLVYLDVAQSRRGQPNENFAREVMELFTLGEGRYGEQDIREAARAFTGWSIDPENGEYLYRPFIHDGGAKTVLGRSGEWRGEHVLDILLEQPATAEYIVAKLWKEFVSPEPDRNEVTRIAGVFRKNYSIGEAMRELLLTRAFWSPENRAALVKSPVEVVVGALRGFDVRIGDPLPFVLLLRQLGQDLFSPPNVKGWPGGTAWINAQTLLARRQFVDRLLRVDERGDPKMEKMRESMRSNAALLKPGARRFAMALLDVQFDGGEWLGSFNGREHLVPLVLLAGVPVTSSTDKNPAERLRHLAADPMYQLK